MKHQPASLIIFTLAALSLLSVSGAIGLIACGRTVPGELWQVISGVVGGLLGYITVPRKDPPPTE